LPADLFACYTALWMSKHPSNGLGQKKKKKKSSFLSEIKSGAKHGGLQKEIHHLITSAAGLFRLPQIIPIRTHRRSSAVAPPPEGGRDASYLSACHGAILPGVVKTSRRHRVEYPADLRIDNVFALLVAGGPA